MLHPDLQNFKSNNTYALGHGIQNKYVQVHGWIVIFGPQGNIYNVNYINIEKYTNKDNIFF